MRETQISTQCQRRCTSISRVVGIVVVTCLLAACDDDDIRVYRAPKDLTFQTVQTSATPPPADSTAVTWTLPDGWEQIPGERSMRIATFRAGPDESAPEISLSAFPGDAGGLLPNINRWREQIGLEPIDNEELSTLVYSTTIDGVVVTVVDMLGADKSRMLGAVITPGDGQTWFVKATDAPDRIETLARSFHEFARSFRLATANANAVGLPAARSPQSELHDRLSQWSPPPHWLPDPEASPILSAAFLASNNDDGARITVTSLRGTGGGALANINRWRGQLGLEPLASLEEQPTTDLGGDALSVDLVSVDQSSRMIAAILPSSEFVWYFKMTGSAAGVAAERGNFENFVRVVGLGDEPSLPNASGATDRSEDEP